MLVGCRRARMHCSDGRSWSKDAARRSKPSPQPSPSTRDSRPTPSTTGPASPTATPSPTSSPPWADSVTGMVPPAAHRVDHLAPSRPPRRGQGHAMVLRPWRAESPPRAVQHIVSPDAQDALSLVEHRLGVEETQVPAACSSELGQHPPDGIARASHGARRASRCRRSPAVPSTSTRRPQRAHPPVTSLSEPMRAPRPPVRLWRRRRAPCVMDRCRSDTRFDQLDPATIHHPVPSRGRDQAQPMVGDTHMHASIVAQIQRLPGGRG